MKQLILALSVCALFVSCASTDESAHDMDAAAVSDMTRPEVRFYVIGDG